MTSDKISNIVQGGISPSRTNKKHNNLPSWFPPWESRIQGK